MPGHDPFGHHLLWRTTIAPFVNMNGRLTAVSDSIKQNAPIERSIEEFDCRDLTTKTV